jgi:TPR repeat protein
MNRTARDNTTLSHTGHALDVLRHHQRLLDKNILLAIKYFRRAAEKGNAEAAEALRRLTKGRKSSNS